MPRGPAPKPTLHKQLAQNPGRRPLNSAEPVPERASGSPPEWLSDDARKLWFQLAEPMTTSGLATSVDVLSLGRYCTLLALWIRATAAIEKAKTTAYSVKNRHGTVVGHRELPAFAELRRLGPQLTALEREFGMTPASRTRIKIDRDNRVKADPEDAIDAIFAGRPLSGPVGKIGA